MGVGRVQNRPSMEPPFTQARNVEPDDPVSRITGRPIPRPSDFWLRSPAYMDGAFDPPRIYHSVEEIEEASIIWSTRTGIYPTRGFADANRQAEFNALMARLTPTPVREADRAALERGCLRPSGSTASPSSEVSSGDGEPRPSLAPAPNPIEAPVDTGYTVRVNFLHPPPFVVGARPSKRLMSTTKVLNNVDMHTITRVEFLNTCLDVLGLKQTFSPGKVGGPSFKMYWPGSAGGKTNAASILVDDEFEANKQALFKKRTRPEVLVDITRSELEKYRIQESVAQSVILGDTDDTQELVNGTRVPAVSDFDLPSQMHGSFTLMLQARWPCATHALSGKQGYCYVQEDGEHFQLNPLRMKAWAAAMAAGVATKEHPPNDPMFDEARPVKPRGLTGPRRASRAVDPAPAFAPAHAAPPAVGDTILGPILGSVVASFITNGLKRAFSGSPSPRRPSASKRSAYGLSRFPLPTTPGPSVPPTPMSPIPATAGDEILACLNDLKLEENLDLVHLSSILTMYNLTPDVIHAADNNTLVELLEITLGKVLKLKIYCQNWNARLVEKKVSMRKI